MKVTCPRCDEGMVLDCTSAGKTIRCPGCGKSFVAPQELAVTGQNHTLSALPVATVVLLHFVTAGLFTVIYLNLLHDRMPRLRRYDPTATVAVGLCFVPAVNLVWLIFSLHRLCLRINEQRVFHDLPPTAPEWLAIIPGLMLAAGGLAVLVSTALAWVLFGLVGVGVMPIFAGFCQHAINELCEQQVQPVALT